MRKFISLLCVAVFLISCGGSKKTVISRTETTVPKRTTKIERKAQAIKSEKLPDVTPRKKAPASIPYKERVQRYIYEFSEIAMSEMKTYGIPASITLAQGILESGAGYGELTQRAKNHFGIKCHNWKGDRVYHDDDLSQECFRKYDNASESFRDHSLFLKNRKRYSRLFTFNKKDYKSWARGLREAGYATDKKYPEKLIGIIERYQLYTFDDQVLGRSNKNRVRKEIKKEVKKDIATVVTSPIRTQDGGHVVQQGDTLYSISRRYKISVQELRSYNNLADNTIHVGQVLKVAAEDEEEEDFN
ncbi:glucosaminidase domain-containing protein [Aquimarina mytili]|uniref:Peptidoglycan hydrolase n=1 Tax=Aquimarina mytili TaxID=874423 RepID=A0A937D9G3_9FLAO|nr:glucosaminidase domain-containing protein [Aquimarina mytili]MBL0682468.1 glucosaminidase domain-containing protein [Aquimarina mytili]